MKCVYGVDSIFGNGQTYYDEDGNMVGYSIDSAIGSGQNFYNADGQHVGYSVDSVIGNGQNLYRMGMIAQNPESIISQRTPGFLFAS